jgi:hypothetical protein
VPVNTLAYSCNTDRGHPGPAGPGLRVDVGPHLLDLAIGLGESHDRDVLLIGEAADCTPKRRPDLVEDRRGRDRVPQVGGQEADDLTTDLQVRDVGIQVDPVQALQIQRHMSLKHIIDGHRLGHG